MSNKASGETEGRQSSGHASPAPPIPSGTVLLLRDGNAGLEVFMVVRHHQIDFASGALVFPGGKADPQDFDDNLLPYLTGAHTDPAMRAIQVSTIREAFEECGVLLARELGGDELVSGERLVSLDRYRDALHGGELTLRAFLEQEELRLACDRLEYFAHWITPPMVPKRFDTHFYLAVAPADHLATHDGHESVDSVWVTPADALAGSEDGTYTIIFPTLRNIEMLGESPDVDAAMEMAAKRDVVTVLPWMEERTDGQYICIPPEAGYAISEEKMQERSS